MDEAQVVDRFYGEDTLRHVELGHVLGERVVLDQPVVSEAIPGSQCARSTWAAGAAGTHIVIKSPPGKNSMTKYRYCVSWNE